MKKKKRPKRSMTDLLDAAFEQVAIQVIERARQTNTPLILWVDGKVTEVDPWTCPLPQIKDKDTESVAPSKRRSAKPG